MTTQQNKATQETGLVGYEILAAVFAHFPSKKLDIPLHFKKDLQLAFYKASVKKVDGKRIYEPMFANYPFDTDSATPYSRKLEEGIDTMMQSHMLQMTSGPLMGYVISPACKHSFKKYIGKNLGSDEKELVKQLSGDIQKILL